MTSCQNGREIVRTWPQPRGVRLLARRHAGGGMTVKLHWYRDWRWRYIRDDAGVGVWVGPVGVYFWR